MKEAKVVKNVTKNNIILDGETEVEIEADRDIEIMKGLTVTGNILIAAVLIGQEIAVTIQHHLRVVIVIQIIEVVMAQDCTGEY